MEIIYVSNDEVHQLMAEELAYKYGAMIHKSHFDNTPPNGHWFDAVLYDLDAVGPPCWPALLERIFAEARRYSKAAHGYGISDKMAAALGRHKIAVAQRLCPELMRTLCQAARQTFASPTRTVID
jgi:hypothetical protein